MIQRFLAASTLICICFTAFSCNRGSSSSGGSSGDILIGHVASLTGDTATFGVSADEGIKRAMDEINGNGGILNGRKISVLTEDDRSLGNEAKTATNKLITRDHVVAILGEI